MPLVIRTTGVEDFLSANGEPLVKCLIAGEPNAGKTRSASFWPSPLFLDCEKGRMSLSDRKVPYLEITSSKDMDAALTKMEVHCKTTEPHERRYKTLVVDTVDRFQKIRIQEILRAGKKEALSGFSDWGQLDATMNSLIARLLALPMNIVVNMHIKQVKNGEDGELLWTPRLKGDISDSILEAFDLVGHMSTYWQNDNGERVLRRAIKWGADPSFPGLKDRSGQLPDYTAVRFTDDDYLGLFEAIYGDFFDALPKGEAVDEVEDIEPPVDEPHAGGPVAVKKTTAKAEPAAKAEAKPRITGGVPPAKKAAAPQTAAPPAAKEQMALRASVTAPGLPVKKAEPKQDKSEPKKPPAATFTEPAVDQSMEQAAETVAEQLGGEVISEEPKVEASAVPPATPPAETTASPALPCGTPGKRNTGEPAPGCGRDLAEVKEQDLVNIALIKTQTYLCPDCFTKWRSANKK